jgi:pyrimidine operon attenuation protein/uracil phosphoribosyltransferase
MDENQIERTIKRMTHEIIEKYDSCDQLVLVPILSKGNAIAQLIREHLKTFASVEVPVIPVNIQGYRDDTKAEGPRFTTDLSGKNVVLIDDVLYTGRSVRAALDAIMDAGRPESIALVTLIDRGHRELPIRPDVIGKNIPTRKNETVHVDMMSFQVTVEEEETA